MVLPNLLRYLLFSFFPSGSVIRRVWLYPKKRLSFNRRLDLKNGLKCCRFPVLSATNNIIHPSHKKYPSRFFALYSHSIVAFFREACQHKADIVAFYCFFASQINKKNRHFPTICEQKTTRKVRCGRYNFFALVVI